MIRHFNYAQLRQISTSYGGPGDCAGPGAGGLNLVAGDRMNPAVEFSAGRVVVRFSSFDLEEYEMFVKCKQLPEAEIVCDENLDEFRVSAPSRFAHILGVDPPGKIRESTPLAGHLFDYQRFIVETALHAKRYAAWCDTGLGKTAIFLEFARQVSQKAAGRVLILSPLQIIPQTIDEAVKFYGAG